MKYWLLVLLLLAGCTDAEKSSIMSLGSQFRIIVYSGGSPIKVYKSTGQVQWHEGGGGCEFRDAATNKHVRVSGTLTAEEL